jgi:hypothetical protein
MVRMMTFAVLLLTTTVVMAEPLPVRKAGRQCPAGYASGASYCTPMSGTRRAAIPKQGQCPANWVQSGQYCLSPERK